MKCPAATRPRSRSTRYRARYAELGDPWAGIDAAAGSLEPLLAAAARDEAAGLPDAPWPPHFTKQAGEQPRVQPSKRRTARPAGPAAIAASGPPRRRAGAAGRRRSAMPLIEVARAATKAEAMQGLERWRARHPDAAACLEPADVLVDSMRGRFSTWTRIRLNLRKSRLRSARRRSRSKWITTRGRVPADRRSGAVRSRGCLRPGPA